MHRNKKKKKSKNNVTDFLLNAAMGVSGKCIVLLKRFCLMYHLLKSDKK
jgi:hypothetical protein